MTRTQYNNGDEITLTECGCDGCSPSIINGVLCHETGCPDSWRDDSNSCEWCGQSFFAQERGQEFCDEECEDLWRQFLYW